MKRLRTILPGFVVLIGAATAWGQYGLYGSPELVSLPPVQPAVGVVPGMYPSTQPAINCSAIQPGPMIAAPVTGRYGAPTPPAPPAPPVPPAPKTPTEAASPSPSDAPVLVPTPQRLDVAPARPASPAAAPSLVEQMLNDSVTSSAPSAGCGGCYSSSIEAFEDAACNADNYCYDECCTTECCPWYGQVSALMLSRNKANRVWVTHETITQANQLMNTQDIDMQWKWGGEIRFGRRFCCGAWALEATYWTTEAFAGNASRTDAGNLSTPLTVSGIEFGVGNNATNWFDGADEHRLSRRNEFQNVELDFVNYPFLSNGYSTWDLSWSMGARFFRFEEQLVFSSLRNTGSWSVGNEWAALDDQVINSLIGLQMGFDAHYRIAPSWSLYVGPKFGIYTNHIRHRFNAYLGDGTEATPTAASGVTGSYPVESSANAISFLTEVDLGLQWQISPRWSAHLGYRVIVATGIGLSDNQIPPYIVDIPEIRDIDKNGELILHGATFGLSYNF